MLFLHAPAAIDVHSSIYFLETYREGLALINGSSVILYTVMVKYPISSSLTDVNVKSGTRTSRRRCDGTEGPDEAIEFAMRTSSSSAAPWIPIRMDYYADCTIIAWYQLHHAGGTLFKLLGVGMQSGKYTSVETCCTMLVRFSFAGWGVQGQWDVMREISGH